MMRVGHHGLINMPDGVQNLAGDLIALLDETRLKR